MYKACSQSFTERYRELGVFYLQLDEKMLRIICSYKETT